MEIGIDSLLKRCHKCGDLLSGTKSLTNGVTNTFRELSLYEIFETMHGYCGDTDWDYSGEITRLKTKFKLEGIDGRRPFCYGCLKEEDIHEGTLEDPEEYLRFIENKIKEIEIFKLSDIDPIKSKELSDLNNTRDELKFIVFPEVQSITKFEGGLVFEEYKEKHDEVKYQEFLCKEKDDEHKYRMEEIEKLIENEATKK